MQVFESISEIRKVRWAEPSSTWGLVPTMGYLHEGHLSLVRRARDENDHVAVSIFVNPAQFNNASDLDNYPSDMKRDLALLDAEGVELVWTPEAATVYPEGYQTYVDVEAITLPLEGASRPGHFRGMSTVVSKLFNVFEPTHAYFGQKDAQQALTVKRMVADLNFNLTVQVCDTVREADGLAMSSRNARLTSEARREAPCLFEALTSATAAFADGERDAGRLRQLLRDKIAAAPMAVLEYVSAADPATLAEFEGEIPVAGPGQAVLLSIAAEFGAVRLIDNVLL